MAQTKLSSTKNYGNNNGYDSFEFDKKNLPKSVQVFMIFYWIYLLIIIIIIIIITNIVLVIVTNLKTNIFITRLI